MRIPALIALLAAGCSTGPTRRGPDGDAAAPDSGDAWDAGGPDDAAAAGWPDVPAAPLPDVLAQGLAAPCGVAVSADGLVVAEEGGGRVVRVPFEGGEPVELASGLAGPRLLAVAGDAILVTERAGGAVARIDAAGALRIAESQTNPGRVGTDGEFAYWVAEGTGAADGAVRRVPLEGGAVEDLLTGLVSPGGLAIGGGRAFFTESGPREVGYVPVEGGADVRVADDDGTPTAVAIDVLAGEAYWLSPGTRGGGFIHLSDLDLAGDERVAFTQSGPHGLDLDETHVYFAGGSSVSRAPRAGGDYEDVVPRAAVCDLAVGPGAIFWADASTGRVHRQAIP